MSELLKSIDERTRLAGTNKLEILLFTLGVDPESGSDEVYGINVFKVREVMRVPHVTRVPDMPPAAEGMVSLRGALVPVVDLARYAGRPKTAAVPGKVMIVTEYNGSTQGFLVEAVDRIMRLDWSAMKVPPAMLTHKSSGSGGSGGPGSSLVNAVTELPDGRLVMMIDVERLLAATTEDAAADTACRGVVPLGKPGRTVLFADDSSVARRQIVSTLDAMQVKHIEAHNGRHAWGELERLAAQAEQAGAPVASLLQAVLTDVEMPEMDGYMLTRRIKSDRRFAGIPVIMHSSLSGASNQQLGRALGVDAYVCKFEPQRLADTLTRMLAGA